MATNIVSMKQSSMSRGGWKSAIFIIFVEVAERFAYYGVAGNLFMYLTKVLGQPTATAAKNVNTWQGVSAIFPVVGGFLADSYFGRFKTILLSSIIYLIGLVLLTVAVSAVPLPLRHIVFFIALYILSVGEGGHKPCVQTFAADQFDENVPEEKAAKSSFFNWWYVGIVCGATAAVLVVIYVEDYVGWSLGFGMLAVAVAAALLVFLAGSGGYRREAPVGSPFTRVAQVVVAAARKRGLSEREERGVCDEDDENMEGGGAGVQALARTPQFRFLEKAMMIDNIDASSEKRNPWRLCPVNQVEEAKLVFQLIPIWFSCLMFAIVIAQLGTYFTKQGSTMQRSITPTFQIPAASFQVFTGLTILVSVLLYERALVPLARALIGRPSGIKPSSRESGPVLLTINADHGCCSMHWGRRELFYEQMPVGMRSIGAAAYITVTGVGSFLSSGFDSYCAGISSSVGMNGLGITLIEGTLSIFYWVLAVMSAVNFCGYVCVAKRFVYIRGLGMIKKAILVRKDPIRK
ncbi:protein NRT1/ PTR FAMILY 5.4 [Sesamum alatum]|uniref:Protein NRT1/ PTR FAMILY 5.4 n=1 Tax=Sesamum alatum TaxID=300844 RepID=A0AAE1XMC5_9LAMI|nr:protein NRT1/ PTR FAMILY 5.4 [Sesamum alatum]